MNILSIGPPARAGLLAAASAALLACSAPDRSAAGGGAASPNALAPMTGQGMMQNGTMRRGMMQGGMMQGGMGRQMQDMRTIRALLASHERIEREVQELPNGVRTVTRSEDPQVAALIRAHVRDMHARYRRDQPIRAMDPLFRELFERRDEARLEFRDIPGGIEVLHTSDNPQVVALIRQHADHFVDGVVERGMAGAMGPTPLPERYARPRRR